MVTIDKNGRIVPNKKPKSEKVESLQERAIKIEPEYKEKIKSERCKIPKFTKTDSPLCDSVTKIISIFDSLLQKPPTREVLRWCAHKPGFLGELFEPIKKDLEFLPSRLEEKFPRCSEKISDLIDKLNAAFQEHNNHLFRGPRLYLLPSELWDDFCNYEEFLRWRNTEVIWAMREYPNIESHEEAEDIIEAEVIIKALTCTYPADIIKICAEICKDLEKPYKILLEQAKPRGTGGGSKGKSKRGRKKDPKVRRRNKEIAKYRANNPKLSWKEIGIKFGVSADIARKACNNPDN